MSEQDIKMTRREMQTEAMVIKSLLGAAISLHARSDPQDAMTVIEMAHRCAHRLDIALDAVNAPKGELAD